MVFNQRAGRENKKKTQAPRCVGPPVAAAISAASRWCRDGGMTRGRTAGFTFSFLSIISKYGFWELR